MANICYTMYRFYGDRTEEMFEALNQLADTDNNPYCVPVVRIARELLNMTDKDLIGVEMRGDFSIVNYHDNELMVDTQSKWNPCNEIFAKLADKYEADIYWLADERGCCGIWSNDVDNHVWDWQFVVYNSNTCDEENFATEDDAVDWCNDYLKMKDLPKISELSELDNEPYEGIFCITEIDYIND